MANWWDEQLLQYQMALGQQKAGAGLQQRASSRPISSSRPCSRASSRPARAEPARRTSFSSGTSRAAWRSSTWPTCKSSRWRPFMPGVQQDRDTAQQMHQVVLNDLAHRGRIAKEEILQRHKRDELSQSTSGRSRPSRSSGSSRRTRRPPRAWPPASTSLNSEEDAKNFKDNLNKIGVIDQAYRSGKVSKEQHDEIVEKIRAANLDIQAQPPRALPHGAGRLRGKIRQDLIDELPAEMREQRLAVEQGGQRPGDAAELQDAGGGRGRGGRGKGPQPDAGGVPAGEDPAAPRRAQQGKPAQPGHPPRATPARRNAVGPSGGATCPRP